MTELESIEQPTTEPHVRSSRQTVRCVRFTIIWILILPNDFNSEISDVVLVIFQRRRIITSCPFIAVAAPHRAFMGSHNSTCLINQEKSHCPIEGHFPRPSCADQSLDPSEAPIPQYPISSSRSCSGNSPFLQQPFFHEHSNHFLVPPFPFAT